MKLYKKIIIMFLIQALFLMPSCKKNDEITQAEYSVIPTKLTIGMYASKSYNPLDTLTEYNEQAFFLMYDSLFNINESFKAEGNLATDINIENNGKTATLQIKPNVKFHNGEILTAEDVCYTVNYIIENGGYYSYNVRNIESAHVVNDYTLEFRLKYPTPNFQSQLTFPIISKNSSETFVGSGPYKLLNEKKGKQLNLIKFREYHGDFKSQVDKIEIDLIPDKKTALSLSGSGILDIFFAAYSDEGLKTITKTGSVKSDYLTDSYVFLKINFENPLLMLKPVRKAISLGIDRTKIADDVYMSHAEPTALPIPQSSEIYNKSCSAEKKLEEAASYLKECGYEDRNSDGICEYVVEMEDDIDNALPHTLTVRILAKNDIINASVAKEVEYDLKKIGFVTVVELVSQEEYYKRYSENNYDLCIASTKTGFDMDITAFMGEGGVFSSPIDYNYQSELNKLAATTIEDLKTPTYSELFKRFYENPAHIPIVFLKNTLITNEKFKEFDKIYLNNIYYKILIGKDS